MKRLAIFAHYDKDNIIDDYVIYYLKELKKSFETIIFVSDTDLEKEEIDKISNIVDYVQAYHHGEYDFGSYKYGYFIARKNNLLMDTDELLLCNDSVYGPVCSISSILDKMSNFDCDFWGMYENKHGLYGKIEPHLQSWFLMMKKQVFLSDKFDDFMCKITKKDDKCDIIQDYEIGFTTEMSKFFSYFSLYSSEQSNAVVNAARLLLKKGFPFIKVVVGKKYILNLHKYVNDDLYKFIKRHMCRVKGKKMFSKVVRTLQWNVKMKKYSVTKNY